MLAMPDMVKSPDPTGDRGFGMFSRSVPGVSRPDALAPARATPTPPSMLPLTSPPSLTLGQPEEIEEKGCYIVVPI